MRPSGVVSHVLLLRQHPCTITTGTCCPAFTGFWYCTYIWLTVTSDGVASGAALGGLELFVSPPTKKLPCSATNSGLLLSAAVKTEQANAKARRLRTLSQPVRDFRQRGIGARGVLVSTRRATHGNRADGGIADFDRHRALRVDRAWDGGRRGGRTRRGRLRGSRRPVVEHRRRGLHFGDLGSGSRRAIVAQHRLRGVESVDNKYGDLVAVGAALGHGFLCDCLSHIEREYLRWRQLCVSAGRKHSGR